MGLFSSWKNKETVLKKTISRCTQCKIPVTAEVFKKANGQKEEIIMRRVCPSHGTEEYVISTDARFYWLAQGNPKNKSCCGPEKSCCSSGGGKPGTLGKNALNPDNQGVVEKLATCLALIEIVDSCNLACPTCFADSPMGVTDTHLKYHSVENITSRIQGVIDRKGHIDLVQFSGGEPSIHPQLFELVEWVRKNPDIDYLIINTNGVRFARDEAFVERMGELFKKYDNIQLYLQFDGPQLDGQLELRGVDLRQLKKKAIENCARFGLPITLAMTVNRTNLPHLWDTVQFGLQYDHIRGVSFQPMFGSGRLPKGFRQKTLPQPITPADIILGLHEQSKSLVALDDFTPLPCGDPNCATIGWLMRIGEKTLSPTAMGIDIAALQADVPDKINYTIEDLRRCGCDGTLLGDLMRKMELQESNAFRLFIKPFMDARTWDEDRIDRCCTHVIRPDGKLDSFCRYYFGSP